MPDKIPFSEFTFKGSTYVLKDAVARAAIENLNSFEYIVCTSANDTPQDVTWNNIVGTLVPSEDTKYKIYLVPSTNGTNDLYDEYITVQNGANLTWEKFGNTDINLSSYATKDNPTFTGSLSLGRKANTATGVNSVAIGMNATATGVNSYATGNNVVASGNQAFAEGTSTIAAGTNQHAQGKYNITDTNNTYAEIVGNGTNDSNRSNAYALDWNGNARFAGDVYVGCNDNSTGGTKLATEDLLDDKADKADTILTSTLSRGRKENSTVGGASFAFGKDVVASNVYSHAEGNGSIASGLISHAEGSGTTASGEVSHAEGSATKAIGRNSHAEGSGTTASANEGHAEGSGTTASGDYSHAEGGGSTASGAHSHAEGGATTASGNAAHAEGGATTASGSSSHAEGAYTVAAGYNSHAEGFYTIAAKNEQHVFGRYNIEDSSIENGIYVEIVGNGSAELNRSNARTLDWNGNEKLAGDLTINAGTANEISVSDLKNAIANLSSMHIHICTSGEYDAQTGMPTVQNPDVTTFYLVPGGQSPNLYIEWVYTNNAWEQFGSATIDLSEYEARIAYLESEIESLRQALIALLGNENAVTTEDGSELTDEQGNPIEYDIPTGG